MSHVTAKKGELAPDSAVRARALARVEDILFRGC